MLTDHILEDTAARRLREQRDTAHALMKAAQREPIAITLPLGNTPLAIQKALEADIVPFRKNTPSPSRAPQPRPPSQQPLRPAAKLATSDLRKHSPTDLGDLLISKLLLG